MQIAGINDSYFSDAKPIASSIPISPMPDKTPSEDRAPIDIYTRSEESKKFDKEIGKPIGSDKSDKSETGASKPKNPYELSDGERRLIEELKKRDREVKSHESAHIAAGGGLVKGGAKFNYETGPDGQRYAIGGEVQIDIAPDKDPQRTIQKMQQVRSAALAPADPSGQDRAVAAKAAQIEAQARMELNSEKSTNTAKQKSPRMEKALNAYGNEKQENKGINFDSVAGSQLINLKRIKH